MGPLLLNTSYEEHRMAPVESSGVLSRQMTNAVMLPAGQPSSAPLRRRGDSPFRTLVADDDDAICRLDVAMLIHANLGTVARNMVRERVAGLVCAVVAHHCSHATSLYEGLGVYRTFL